MIASWFAQHGISIEKHGGGERSGNAARVRCERSDFDATRTPQKGSPTYERSEKKRGRLCIDMRIHNPMQSLLLIR